MEAISRITTKSAIHRYLDPGETLAEVLFGLIMVLTITAGAGIVSASEQLDTRKLVAAALGCNVAWGVIDAVLFVLGGLFYRSQRARFFRELTFPPLFVQRSEGIFGTAHGTQQEQSRRDCTAV